MGDFDISLTTYILKANYAGYVKQKPKKEVIKTDSVNIVDQYQPLM